MAVSELTTEQKVPAITIRTAQGPTPTFDTFFGDLPANAGAPKQGQKFEDFFGDLPAPATPPVGPLNERQIVAPPSMPNIQQELFKPEIGVDYATGIPVSGRVNLNRASGEPGTGEDKRSEQEIYLENTYGKGNFRKGANGEWIIKGVKPGQEVAAFPKEGFEGHLGNLDAALVSAAATTGGAALGTVAGAGIGAAAGGPPGGVIGGVVGSGLGAGAGHLVDEGIKNLQGFYNKTGGQLAKDTALEAGVNAAFQGAGPAWNASKQALLNNTSQWLRRFSGVTPETQAIAHSLERLGVTPPIQSLAPELTGLAYQRNLRSMLSADPMVANRTAAVDRRVEEILDRYNFTPVERQQALDYINDVGSARQPGRAGDIIYAAIMNREAQVQGYEQAALQNARNLLQIQQTKWLRAPGTSQKAIADVGENVVGFMEGARRQFSTDMDTIYQAVHEAAGGAKVVDIADVVAHAQELLTGSPQVLNRLAAMGHEGGPTLTPSMIPEHVAPDATVDDIKAIMDHLASLQKTGSPIAAANENNAVHEPIMVTIAEAHQLRSLLREKTRLTGSLNPIGPTRGDYWQLANKVDDAMERTSLGAEGTVKALMDDADRQYKEGIVRFTNADINNMVMRTKAGRVPDPGDVADLILLKNGRAAAKQIYDMLPEVVQEQVKSADIRNIWKAATSVSDFGPGGQRVLNPDMLVRMLDQRALVHDFMYGPDAARDPFLREVRTIALQMKALRGDFPIEQLPQPAVGSVTRTASNQVLHSLREAVTHQQTLVREAQENVRASLVATSPELRQAGARYIMSDEARTVRAGQILTPQEMEVVQREAVTEILRSAMEPTAKGSGRTVSGRGLEGPKGLGGLTDRQKNIIFSAPQLADIELLARETKALFPAHDSDMGASLAAASIKSHLFSNPTAMFRYGKAHLMGALADSATLRNVLAGTIRSDPYRGRRLLGYLAQGGANVAMAVNGQGGGDVTQEPGFQEQMDKLNAAHAPKNKPGYGGPHVE